jgi:hypothetical protein
MALNGGEERTGTHFLLCHLQLKGNEGAVNFYRLCFRLVSQKSLQFFRQHRDWIDHADETFGAKAETGSGGCETGSAGSDVFLPCDYKSTLSLVRHVHTDTTG